MKNLDYIQFKASEVYKECFVIITYRHSSGRDVFKSGWLFPTGFFITFKNEYCDTRDAAIQQIESKIEGYKRK